MSRQPLYPSRDLLMPSDREVVAEQLRAAARIIEDEGPDEQAAWRLIEALEDFVALARASGVRRLPGIDEPTGRGAQFISTSRPA